MEVRTLIKRGTDHHVYCEDDLYHFNIGSTYIGAVFDGCSTGVKSHFASALFAKIIKANTIELNTIIDIDTPENIAKTYFQVLHMYLRRYQSELHLNVLEMLSTMILAVVRKNKAYIIVSGDGCILADDEEIRIESEGNAPDYLAYYLSNLMEAQESLKTYECSFEKSLSICSDGIYSFTKDREDKSQEVVEALLKDQSFLKSDAMLARKYNLLTKEGITNYDDLSIIRFIL